MSNTEPRAGAITRADFQSNEMQVQAETASTAIAAMAEAGVKARFAIAQRMPRDFAQVRDRLLRECDRPGFAEAARYSKPIGGKPVEGFTIRFAEAAIRCMRNIEADTQVVYEDSEKRILRVCVTDLEANLTLDASIVIAKTVERSTVREGQTVIGQRINTSGRKVFIVEATEDELLVKQAALVSKAIRTSALRLVPGDLLDEAEARVAETLKRGDGAQDPEALRKKLADGFVRLGVPLSQVAEYLGHSLDTMTSEEIAELKRIGVAMKEEGAKWSEVIEARRSERGTQSSTPEAKPASATEKLKGQMGVKTAAPVVEPSAPEPPVADGMPAVDEAQFLSERIAQAETVGDMNAIVGDLDKARRRLGAAHGVVLAQWRAKYAQLSPPPAASDDVPV